jgi:hypothetical protein
VTWFSYPILTVCGGVANQREDEVPAVSQKTLALKSYAFEPGNIG